MKQTPCRQPLQDATEKKSRVQQQKPEDKKYKPFVQLRHAPILTVLPWMQTKIKNTHPLFNDTIRADDDHDPASER